VVDNNAQSGTEEEVRKTSARLVKEPRQGYGHASRPDCSKPRRSDRSGEPDGTFVPDDIQKLLVYSTECDAVFAHAPPGAGVGGREHGLVLALG